MGITYTQLAHSWLPWRYVTVHLLEWEIPFPQSVKTPTYFLSCLKAPLRILAPWQILKGCVDATQSNSCISHDCRTSSFVFFTSRDKRITVCGGLDCINHKAWLGVFLPVDAHMRRLHRRDVWQVLSHQHSSSILFKMVSRSTAVLIWIIKLRLWCQSKLSPSFPLCFKAVRL